MRGGPCALPAYTARAAQLYRTVAAPRLDDLDDPALETVIGRPLTALSLETDPVAVGGCGNR